MMKSGTMEIGFIGTQDDGLAQRQTGKAMTASGNALEALEMFTTAMEFNKKKLHPSVYYHTRILDTGDADMIKVPALTKIRFYLYGNTEEILKDAMEKIYTTAHGAALMAGCKAERS